MIDVVLIRKYREVNRQNTIISIQNHFDYMFLCETSTF